MHTTRLGYQKLKPDTIKVIVTSVPQITEMVYYPLKEPAAFTIIKTEANRAFEISEYNVKMVRHDELDRFIEYLKYLLYHEETQVWEFDEDGRRSPRKINDADRKDFFKLTDVPV